jgi:CxxC motif-containing protein
MKKTFTCIICPKSCKITVNTETYTVRGNSCIRGKQYVFAEIADPRRTLTSTVKINSERYSLLPVKTDRPIKKGNIFLAMEEIANITVNVPVRMGDIIVSDFTEEGTNLISTKTILE